MYSVRSCGSRVQPCARCGLGGSEPIARTFEILRHRAAERLHLARPCQLDRAQQSSVRTQARPIQTRTTRRTKGGWTHASPKPYARRRLRSSTEPPSFRAPSAAFVKTGPSGLRQPADRSRLGCGHICTGTAPTETETGCICTGTSTRSHCVPLSEAGCGGRRGGAGLLLPVTFSARSSYTLAPARRPCSKAARLASPHTERHIIPTASGSFHNADNADNGHNA